MIFFSLKMLKTAVRVPLSLNFEFRSRNSGIRPSPSDLLSLKTPGWKFRFEHKCETIAIFSFLTRRFYVDVKLNSKSSDNNANESCQCRCRKIWMPDLLWRNRTAKSDCVCPMWPPASFKNHEIQKFGLMPLSELRQVKFIVWNFKKVRATTVLASYKLATVADAKYNRKLNSSECRVDSYTVRCPNKGSTKFCDIEWNKGIFPLFIWIPYFKNFGDNFSKRLLFRTEIDFPDQNRK